MPVEGVPITPFTTTPLSKWAVVTAPTDRPVTYATAKGHLRLPSDDDQTYVELLIDAATEHAQAQLATSLMPQTLAAVFNADEVTPGRSGLILPRGPVSAVVSVVDANDVTVAGSELERTHCGDRLRLTAAAAFPIVVTYTTGYASATAVPADIRVAILTHVGTLYENRESVSKGSAVPVPHTLADFYRLRSRRIPVG